MEYCYVLKSLLGSCEAFLALWSLVEPLKSCEALWGLVEPYGALCSLERSSRVLWISVDSCGVLWSLMES